MHDRDQHTDNQTPPQPWLGYNSPAQFWHDLYRPSLDGEWSAKVNAVLNDTMADEPCIDAANGRRRVALDLGCGHGGDAMWLARCGWQVIAVDIAQAAVERVRRQAEAEGLEGRVTARQFDLASLVVPAGNSTADASVLSAQGLDLVSAQYLQTPFDFPRAAALRKLAEQVRPGGQMIVVDHASSAPWMWKTRDSFPSAEQTLAELELDPDAWTTEICEGRDRVAGGPGGQSATVTDNIIGLRRTS